jgi:two-component system phosphate regulon response regulator PhoB
VAKKAYTILIIEDEPDISELIEYSLTQSGYSIIVSDNGEKGIEFARKHSPDLILLDLMLPGINGIDVCRVLKNDKDTSEVSIIMLTALGQEEDIIKGLETGADDYVTKPFSFPVLEARIQSVLRRVKKDNIKNENVSNSGIVISSRKREVHIDGKKIEDLTFTEFQILHLLASHPGWVFTRYQIIDKIRGDNYPVTDRSVDFQIVGLRKKMGKKGKLINTIRGVGYRFQPNET